MAQCITIGKQRGRIVTMWPAKHHRNFQVVAVNVGTTDTGDGGKHMPVPPSQPYLGSHLQDANWLASVTMSYM